MKHTPGPWEMWREQAGNIAIHRAGMSIARIHKNSPQSLENAKLITAAPELLEACQYVVNWHREHDSGEGELFGLDFVTTCINAIRKAKGEV